MSFPTVLSPWFVVFRDSKRGSIEYFKPQQTDEDKELFTESKAFALVFTSLQSAARVADSEVAMIRALVTKDDAKEFGRG